MKTWNIQYQPENTIRIKSCVFPKFIKALIYFYEATSLHVKDNLKIDFKV